MSFRPYALVAAGGAVGAVARHLTAVATGGGPATTFAINVVGCLAIGVLAARTAEGSAARLFAGAGVLGGFTTFSGYAVDAVTLVDDGRAWLAALYVGGTVAAAIGATALGAWAFRRPAGPGRGSRPEARA